MNDLILSLGSNIRPEELNLKNGINELNNFFKLFKLSSLYISYPLEDTNQDKFYNICAFYDTNIDNPVKILEIIKQIEVKLGRIKDKSRPKGPRIIDIDILFFGNIEVKTEKLTIPHEKLLLRKFVLKPLIEILPKDSIYYKKYDLLNNLKSVKEQKIKKIGALKFE
jgi:2-amino-4-hydroxy-6-hydroxymethyldihydropteridine diphosphokinase